jgi:hypothetical protein
VTEQLPIEALIASALASPELRERAGDLLAAHLTASRPFARRPKRKLQLRRSDMGKCTRSLAAELHGLVGEERRTARDYLCKLDQGTLMGAHAACLLAIAVDVKGGSVVLEFVVDGDVPGHVDALVRWPEPEHNVSKHVVEFKWAMRGDPATPPHTEVHEKVSSDRMKAEYHITQATGYALETAADWAYVVTVSPAAKADQPWINVAAYEPELWRAVVEEEIARLSVALTDGPWPADPKQKWRCRACPYTACERNPEHGMFDEVDDQQPPEAPFVIEEEIFA